MHSSTLCKPLALVAAISLLIPAQLALSSCAPANDASNNITASVRPGLSDGALEHEYNVVNRSGTDVYIVDRNVAWSGDHRCDTIDIGTDENLPADELEVLSFQDYKDQMGRLEHALGEKLVSNDYTDPNLNYIVWIDDLYATMYTKGRIYDCIEEDGELSLYAGMDNGDVVMRGYLVVAAIPTESPVGTKINFKPVQTQAERFKSVYDDKPIVYLYPERTCDVSVKLSSPELLRCSYPGYDDGWNVTARPDGSLVDLETGRSLYALYYESASPSRAGYEDGFVVSGAESAAFLEEKLAALGLNEREAEEFIVYWLPKLEANPYNFIHFLTKEEIDDQMGLSIEPSPDSTIRVWMAFESLDERIDVEEQVLESPQRSGFVAVEWGGIEL